jgi:hypothetical protein
MSEQDTRILFHISKVVEGQAEVLNQLQKEVHLIQIQFAEFRASGRIITPTEDKTQKVKDRVVVGGIGGAVATILHWVASLIQMKQ